MIMINLIIIILFVLHKQIVRTYSNALIVITSVKALVIMMIENILYTALNIYYMMKMAKELVSTKTRKSIVLNIVLSLQTFFRHWVMLSILVNCIKSNILSI